MSPTTVVNFGGTAMYSCGTGYMVTGGTNPRTCGGTANPGTWSGTAPTCTPTPPTTCTLVYDFPAASGSSSAFRIQPSLGATTVNIGGGRIDMDQFFGPVSGVTTETRICLLENGAATPSISPDTWLDRSARWSQHLNAITLSANLTTLVMGNRNGGSTASAWTHVPNNDNGWTGFSLAGTLNAGASTCDLSMLP